MRRELSERRKVQALKKIVFNYRRGVRRILERSERVLERYPDARVAMENKLDCEALLRMEEATYAKLRRELDRMDFSQKRLEEVEVWIK